MAEAGRERPWTSDDPRFAFLGDPRFAFLRAALEQKAEEHGRQRALREEAHDAVRQAAAREDGDDRDALLGILVSELRTRALKVPPRPFLDMQLDAVLDPSSVDREQVQAVAGDLAEGSLRALSSVIDLVDNSREETLEPEASRTSRPAARRKGKRKHSGKPGSHRRDHRPILPVFPDRDRTTEVLLGDGAEAVVASHQEPHRRVPDSARSMPLIGPMLDVATRSINLGTNLGLDQVSGLIVRRTQDDKVEVQLGGNIVGQLDDDATAAFLPVLNNQRGAGRRTTTGLRYRDQRGVVHLWIHLPDPRTPL